MDDTRSITKTLKEQNETNQILTAAGPQAML
jgi:hypothetical protein